MKTIKINKEQYDLHFGIDFIREMDKRHQVDANGFPLGVGVQAAVIHLVQRNPVILEDIILSATHTLKSIPSKAEIEAWLEEQENLEAVFEDFLTSLKNAPILKNQVNKLLEAGEA